MQHVEETIPTSTTKPPAPPAIASTDKKEDLCPADESDLILETKSCDDGVSFNDVPSPSNVGGPMLVGDDGAVLEGTSFKDC